MANKRFSARYERLDELKELINTQFDGDNSAFLDIAMVISPVYKELFELHQNDINQALDLRGIDLSELIKRAVLDSVLDIVEQHNQIKELETDTGELQKTTSKGFAEYRINECFDALKRYNQGCDDIMDRWYINYSLLYALTGSNTKALKEWMVINEGQIDQHHRDVGLSDVPRSFNASKKLTGIDGTTEYGSKKMPSRKSDEYLGWLESTRSELGLSKLAE